jgi:amidase
MKIAMLPEPPGGRTDPGIANAIRSVGDLLSNAGHDVVEVVPPDYETVIALWAQILIADVRQQQELLSLVMGEGGQKVLANLERELEPTDLAGVLTSHLERYRVMQTWSAFFTEYPILISPTWALPAFEHGADLDPAQTELVTDTIRPVVIANLLGTPAAITPAGVVGGLPVGVQVMGDRFSDQRCLTVAAEIESLVGTFTPINPITS